MADELQLDVKLGVQGVDDLLKQAKELQKVVNDTPVKAGRQQTRNNANIEFERGYNTIKNATKSRGGMQQVQNGIATLTNALQALFNSAAIELNKQSKAVVEKIAKIGEQITGLKDQRSALLKNFDVDEGKLFFKSSKAPLDYDKLIRQQQSSSNYVKRISGGKASFADIRSALGGDYSKISASDPGLVAIQNTADQIASKYIEQLNKINQAIASATAQLESLQQVKDPGNPLLPFVQNSNTVISNAGKQKDSFDANTEDVVKFDEATKNLNTSLQKQTTTLGRAFKQFSIYHMALNLLKSAVREAVSTIKELDKSLTEQAMVTGLSRDQAYELVDSYQELALITGSTTKEIASVATEYMKQGETIENSLILTQAAVSAAKVARVSVGESVDYLTTALRGFQMSAEDAMSVSDKFAKLAAASATDYDELAIALSKVASQANLAGMSIDYTLALLTQGLETTREAPETMGTALKTIIARMRELTDYGATLEGDTDINTVESQLAYVGIALRDANGELRSTEEVLDELGRKWDTLNTNQQAALAKALAGTRQQSRLIAMMDNYERVLEFQQMSISSTGATAAQSEVYLSGMEAAMNKITVAWEKLITTFTDSDLIIGIFDTIARMLDNIGTFFQNTAAQVGLFTVIGVALGSMITQRVIENNLAKQRLVMQKQEQINLLKQRKSEIEQIALATSKNKKTQNEISMINQQTKATVNLTKAQNLQNKTAKGQTLKGAQTKQLNQLSQQADQIDANTEKIIAQDQAQTQFNASMLEGTGLESEYKNITDQLSYAQNNLSITTKLQNVALMAQMVIYPIITLLHMHNAAMKQVEATATTGLIAKTKAYIVALKQQVAAQTAANATNPLGWVMLAVTAITAIGVAIASMIDYRSDVEKTVDSINELGVEITQLKDKLSSIETAASSFDDLDSKLIKTNDDLKEMDEILDGISDKLDEDESKYYASLGTDAERRNYLNTLQQSLEKEIIDKGNQQLRDYLNLNEQERKDFLDKTDADSVQAKAYLKGLNSTNLLQQLKQYNNLSTETLTNIQEIGNTIIGAMDEATQIQWAVNGTAKAFADLLASAHDIVVETADGTQSIDAFSVLYSSSYSLKERTKAYEELYEVLSINTEALEALKAAYSEFEIFKGWGDDALDFIDKVELSTDEINTMWNAWEELQKHNIEITQQEWQELYFNQFLQRMTDTNGDFSKVLNEVFGGFLDGTEETLNAFVTALGDAFTTGILNMGQNIESLSNTIDNFYKNVAEWNTMSDTDKTEFIIDNADLFAGEQGQELYDALQDQDYNRLQAALESNEALANRIQKEIERVEMELNIEKARVGEDYNAGYVSYLEDTLAHLKDTDNLYKVSLETRLEQEQNFLDIYKSYLEDQQEALEDSLDKRKEAYENYFDSLEDAEEDADYEEQAQLLVSNLSKLGSSTNATANSQRKELEQSLKELEQDRLETLRERARDAILENIDDQVDEISNKFDKLLNNNQLMLAALTGELQNNPTGFLTALAEQQIQNGATTLELQDWWNSTVQALSPFMSDFDFGSFLDFNTGSDTSNTTNNNQVYLNGQLLDLLDEDTYKSLIAIIQQAMNQIGYR